MKLDNVLNLQAAANQSNNLEKLSQEQLNIDKKNLIYSANIEKSLDSQREVFDTLKDTLNSESKTLSNIESAIKNQSSNILVLASTIQASVKKNNVVIFPQRNPTRAQTPASPQPILAGGGAGQMPPATSKEDQLENIRLMERQNDLLEKIEENTRMVAKPEKAKAEDSGFSLGKLGLLGTALAIALGAIVGAVAGYVKALIKINKFLFNAVGDAIVGISKFFPKLRKILINIEMTIAIGLGMIKDAFGNFVKRALSVFDSIGDFVKLVKENKAVKAISTFIETAVTAVKNFIDPIIDAFKTIQKASTPISEAIGFIRGKIGAIFEFFSGIGSKLGAFSSIFGAVAKIVSKLALPLTIIMAIWDTVKGAIEGYEKEGIIGALSGAIKGLISSLVTAPLDMLKDAVSWILDMFGFDKASKFLDSFSFDDIMKSFVDAVFHPIDTIKAIFSGAMKFLEGIEIPKLEFKIPGTEKVLGSIGPFRPFSSDEKPAESAAGSTAGASEKVTGTPASKDNKTDPNKVKELEKENAAYEKLSFFDKRKVDVGYAKATELLAAQAPTSADKVATSSAKNEQAKVDMNKQAATSSTVVSAPSSTTVTNQTAMVKVPTRNQDNAVRSYVNSRY